jgi:hypothetical protein
MANPLISRDDVHTWSEGIADQPEDHQAAMSRLLKSQRRLTRFVEENADSMHPATGGIASYMIGVIIRIFDLGGGKLKSATWAQVRTAEASVMGAVGNLLPLDDGFAQRCRDVSRAQPHILDEALMALFDSKVAEGEEEPDQGELLKIYLLMWVATEVLEVNWTPPKSFAGDAEYTYVHIEPKKPVAKED